jgi:DNA-binding phage protein
MAAKKGIKAPKRIAHTRFDAADYLRSEADIETFLSISREGDPDPAHIAAALAAAERARKRLTYASSIESPAATTTPSPRRHRP